jgi:hypothetical protein
MQGVYQNRQQDLPAKASHYHFDRGKANSRPRFAFSLDKPKARCNTMNMVITNTIRYHTIQIRAP